MKRLWLWFLAYFHLSDKAVCRLSEGRGLNDYHDYHDDELGLPTSFVVLKCKRCGKDFVWRGR